MSFSLSKIDNKSLLQNSLLPIIDGLIELIPDPSVKLSAQGAWLPLKVFFGIYASYNPLEAKEFTDEVKNKITNSNEITEQELQQSLLITFDMLIKTRTEERRKIIQDVFLNGYLESTEKDKFALERFYSITNQISFEAITHLRFLKREILPVKRKDIMAKVNESVSKESNLKRTYWRRLYWNRNPESLYVQKWITENYSISGSVAKKREPFPFDHTHPKWVKWADKWEKSERTESSRITQITSELISLGIMRVYGEGTYSLTSFGAKFLNFIPKSNENQ